MDSRVQGTRRSLRLELWDLQRTSIRCRQTTQVAGWKATRASRYSVCASTLEKGWSIAGGHACACLIARVREGTRNHFAVQRDGREDRICQPLLPLLRSVEMS